MNEPVTIDEDGAQWQELADRMINAIREVDPAHLIVVDRLYGVRGRYGAYGIPPRFVVEDANVLYDSHFYDPVVYTHAGSTWRTTPVGDGGTYPDATALIPTGVHEQDVEATIKTARAESETTDWQYYSSEWQKAEGKKLVAAEPQISIYGALSGKVYFDDLRVFERDANGDER